MEGEGQDATQVLATALMGPLYAGWSAQLYLAGVFFASFTYYIEGSRWESHSARMKALLAVVAGLLAVQTTFSFVEIFYFGVSQVRTAEAFLKGHWPMTITPTVTGIIACVVQVALMRRAGSLFVKAWARYLFYTFLTLVILMSLMGSCIVTGIGVLYLQGRPEVAEPLTFNIGVGIWLIGAAVCDSTISLALFWNLRARAKSAGGFNPTTAKLLGMLIRTALQTAAYTAINSIGGAVVSVAFDESNLMTTDIPYAFFLPMSSLYALSLLTTLNSRKKISQELSRANHVTELVTGGQGIRSRGRSRQSSKGPSPLRIQVHTMQEIAVEESHEEEEDDLERSIRHMKLQAGSIV